MVSTQLLLTIATIAVALFLMSGGMSLLNMLINGPQLSEPYPKIVALTPIAMFLTVLGVTGAYLVMLVPSNLKNGNGNLAQKQLFIGGTLLVGAYLGLELLLNFGLQ